MNTRTPPRPRARGALLAAGLLALPSAAFAVPPDDQRPDPRTTSSAVRTTTGVACEHPTERAPGTSASAHDLTGPCVRRATDAPPVARGGGPQARLAPAHPQPPRAVTPRSDTAAPTSRRPARPRTPPARGGGPRGDCTEHERGIDGRCIAPDLAPNAPQRQWDRDPRLPPANQQNDPGPAPPQASAPSPGGSTRTQ